MKHRTLQIINAAALAALIFIAPRAEACTNLLAGRKATADGSIFMTYADDSHGRFGFLHGRRGAAHAPGSKRAVYDWGTDEFRGYIPQAERTYTVVGNMNEHQVAIGETTWGGHRELEDTTGNNMLDYGSLIYIALERARTAREAIDIITSLADEYGYASTGETLSIIDKNEMWLMEIIGKGAEKGAVWIAVRIPDGAITGHANEPRIRKVNMKDKENVLYSKDLISFARKRGYFNGKDEDFSFADVFATHSPSSRRSCDARVYSYFRRFASPEEDAQWLKWCTGESDEPMPLYIFPNKKVALRDIQERMRDHFEDTPFDMHHDVGAGPNHVPYRWRPMGYEVDGKRYAHERAIATQQTAWSFVAQTRADLPDPIGGILWFGTDDANTTVYMPFYCSMTEVPFEVKEGNGDLNTYSDTANFWMTNWVANQAYNRYDLMIPDIRKVQSGLENKYIDSRAASDKELLAIYELGDLAELEKAVNEQGAAIAKEATDAYRDLGRFLLVRYLDGNIKPVDANGNFTRTKTGHPTPPKFGGYNQEYYDNIVRATGDHFLVRPATK